MVAAMRLRTLAGPADDAWFLDQAERHLEQPTGWWVLHEGETDGIIVGGNLCTLNLLQGTPFMPPPGSSVVFAEDDAQVRPHDFDRTLLSLLQQPRYAHLLSSSQCAGLHRCGN
jgi:muramoyltetrapeptide carboxypeptidase